MLARLASTGRLTGWDLSASPFLASLLFFFSLPVYSEVERRDQLPSFFSPALSPFFRPPDYQVNSLLFLLFFSSPLFFFPPSDKLRLGPTSLGQQHSHPLPATNKFFARERRRMKAGKGLEGGATLFLRPFVPNDVGAIQCI